MLLGAAKYLAETRNFDGTAVVIFQPAEEGGGGGKAMVEDGLMTRWNIQEVYGMHNMPGLPEGHFATTPGAMLASSDNIQITVRGKGGHAGAGPHKSVDSVLIGSQIVNALQSIVARNVVGHSDIAPKRKIDPGLRFPWRTLAPAGLGLWPRRGAVPVAGEIEAALQRFGYPPAVDVAPADIVMAFQRRYRPDRVDGVADPETRALLADLLDQVGGAP